MRKFFKGITLIILIITIILLVQFVWAKYITEVKGNAVSDIAHFNFNVSEQSSNDLIIDLADTRLPDDTTSVEDKTVAPGTKGALAFDINADVSDISLEYNIDIDIKDVPKNLIFYSDREMKNAIYHSENIINIRGFFSSDVENKQTTDIIYWYWPLETGQTPEEIDNNDFSDSLSIGAVITANIHVTGNQIRKVPTISRITYNANGGVIDSYGNSEKLTKTISNDGIIPTASKIGYKFSGWLENLFEGVTFTEQFISPNNQIVSADFNNLLSDYIPVEQGATYEFSLSHNETKNVDWYGYAWYSDMDVDSIIGSRYAGYLSWNFEGFTLNMIAPEGAKYLRIGARHMNVGSNQGGDEITSANYSLISYVGNLSSDLLNGVDMTPTYILADNQIASADLNNLLSDYIQVEEGVTYEFRLKHNKTTNSDWYGYAWYTDKDIDSIIGSRNFMLHGSEHKEGFTISVTAPEGAKYLRIGARHINVGSNQGGDEITSAEYSLKRVSIKNKILFAIWDTN